MRDRKLSDVIEAIQREVPTDERELIGALKATRDSVRYMPPEMRDHWWCELGEILNEHLGEADAPWKERIAAILKGEPNEKSQDREPRKRYLIVNIDKHQDDVTACDEITQVIWDDVYAGYTMVIDFELQMVQLGHNSMPLDVK